MVSEIKVAKIEFVPTAEGERTKNSARNIAKTNTGRYVADCFISIEECCFDNPLLPVLYCGVAIEM